MESKVETPPLRSVSFSIGNVMVVDKVNDVFNFFNELFDGLHTKAHLKQTAKLGIITGMLEQDFQKKTFQILKKGFLFGVNFVM